MCQLSENIGSSFFVTTFRCIIFMGFKQNRLKHWHIYSSRRCRDGSKYHNVWCNEISVSIVLIPVGSFRRCIVTIGGPHTSHITVYCHDIALLSPASCVHNLCVNTRHAWERLMVRGETITESEQSGRYRLSHGTVVFLSSPKYCLTPRSKPSYWHYLQLGFLPPLSPPETVQKWFIF